MSPCLTSSWSQGRVGNREDAILLPTHYSLLSTDVQCFMHSSLSMQILALCYFCSTYSYKSVMPILNGSQSTGKED